MNADCWRSPNLKKPSYTLSSPSPSRKNCIKAFYKFMRVLVLSVRVIHDYIFAGRRSLQLRGKCIRLLLAYDAARSLIDDFIVASLAMRDDAAGNGTVNLNLLVRLFFTSALPNPRRCFISGKSNQIENIAIAIGMPYGTT
jgi:hypothetical protein